MENLKADSEKQFRIGNLYISDVKSFKDIRRSFQQGETSEMRNLVVGMGFLLLNIFLGLLGTFRHRAGPLRTELLAQRHYAGVATPAVLRRRYVCPHRRHDRCWYRTSCPPCHEGAAGGGVAR